MNAQQTTRLSVAFSAPILSGLALFLIAGQAGGADSFAAVSHAMQECIATQEVAGVVTLIATRDKVLDLQAAGWADIAAKAPMQTNAIFWIASMTKPITATAVLMLQEEGKLSVGDPVAKYLPELGNLKTAEGKSAKLTLRQVRRRREEHS
jgi:CubicO group peptidase (beta-lactamase class C family)